MSETPPAIPGQPPPLARWKIRAGIFTFLLLGAILFFGKVEMSMAPRFERMFEEMLGTRDKIPTVAQWAVGLSRFVQNNALIILLFLPIPFVLLWWRRGRAWICVVCGALTLMLAGLSVGTYLAMVSTSAQIIRNLGADMPEMTDEEREQLLKDLQSGKSPS